MEAKKKRKINRSLWYPLISFKKFLGKKKKAQGEEGDRSTGGGQSAVLSHRSPVVSLKQE